MRGVSVSRVTLTRQLPVRSHTAHTGDLHLGLSPLMHTPRPARRPKPNADSPHDVELLSAALAPHHFWLLCTGIMLFGMLSAFATAPDPDAHGCQITQALGDHTDGLRPATDLHMCHRNREPSPRPRLMGCCRPRHTASCCCCCGCDSSPGVRVHTAHDDAPGIGTIECARSQHAPPGLTPRHIGYPGLVFAAPNTLPPATSVTRVSSLPYVS